MSCVVLEYKTWANLDPNWGKNSHTYTASSAQIREMRKDEGNKVYTLKTEVIIERN